MTEIVSEGHRSSGDSYCVSFLYANMGLLYEYSEVEREISIAMGLGQESL